MIFEEHQGSNLPVLSVSDLSFSLKSLIEDRFSYVRVRGELSKVTLAKSGHLYTTLKDENAVLDAVCWKGAVAKLNIKPEEGLEVICTGRLTTYPGRSNYQIVIETMELAGQGALLKMLEDRRKRLAAEGLFNEDRKKKLPFLPRRIGIVTSPTGAVIRDILHRLNDRFPRPVLVWPVMVQGQAAAGQIAHAIEGFNNLPEPMRPDIIIVARGGGSFEDLMPFQEEIVVRAAANSHIPLISAVGHETDTTLIDYAADKRAPTPTAAAEFAVPVKQELQIHLENLSTRLKQSQITNLAHLAQKIESLRRGLGKMEQIFDPPQQRLDFASLSLERNFTRIQEQKSARVATVAAQLKHPKELLNYSEKTLIEREKNLHQLYARFITDLSQKLSNKVALLETLSFKATLERGFVLARTHDGQILSSAAQTENDKDLVLQWHDGERKAQIQKI